MFSKHLSKCFPNILYIKLKYFIVTITIFVCFRALLYLDANAVYREAFHMRSAIKLAAFFASKTVHFELNHEQLVFNCFEFSLKISVIM